MSNCKLTREYSFQLPADLIPYNTFFKLKALKTLHLPYCRAGNLSSLQIQKLLIRINEQLREAENGTIQDLPELILLRFDFEDGSWNHGLPDVDLDTLPKLRQLIVSNPHFSGNFKLNITRPTLHLNVVDVDTTHRLSWLHYTKDSLRHLVLSAMDDGKLPTDCIEFNRVECLELHWCNFSKFNEMMQFPSITHYSESSQLYEDSNCDPLHIARVFLDRLNVLGLRFEYDRRVQHRPIHNLSATYNILEQAKRTKGRLERCLMQGSVTQPPGRCKSWIAHKSRRPPEDVQVGLEHKKYLDSKRCQMLKWLGRRHQFREYLEPERFRNLGPWL